MPRWIFCLVILIGLSAFIFDLVLISPIALVPMRLWLWVFQHQVWIFPLSLAELAVIALVYLQLVRRYETYKGIRAIAQRERPFDAYQTWSTHLGAPIMKTLCWRLTGLLGLWKPNDKFLRVLEHKDDRQVVNSMSLYAFETMLREHRTKLGVLIISTSLLNRRNRSATRLQWRIDAVRNQPGWRCELVVRDLGVVLSAASRFQFGWQSVPGEKRFRFQAPGIVAWRAADGDLSDAKWRTRLKTLGLRVATPQDLKSQVFSG